MTFLRLEGEPEVERSGTAYKVTLKLAGAQSLTSAQLTRLRQTLNSRTSNLAVDVVVEGDRLEIDRVRAGSEPSIVDTLKRAIHTENAAIAEDEAAWEAAEPERREEAKRQQMTPALADLLEIVSID